MATITTNTFLDDGTARTAGEAWTMNGGILTIRTDSRVHANAPANMTGSIAAVTISATLGGGLLIDGRNVRWMAFDSGSGNVPPIGTLITQGAVEGYLLGVWVDLSTAPTAPGQAMPASGFLKFREVTGGRFAIGALSGIGANATEADRVGWIEVVQRQSVTNTVPRMGFFRTRGDWFELGVTTGTPGQIVQTPTNGGGAGTHVPAVWIETGVGTNQYDAYPGVLSTFFIATNLGTDARSKFVETMGSGQIRIGNNGTVDVGFTPPAGCRIRIPNVIGRQSASGTDSTNQVPHATLANRPDFTTTSAGDIDFEFFINDWYHLFANPFNIRHVNCATFDILSASNVAAPMDIDNFIIGQYQGTSISLTLTSNSMGGVIKNSKFFRTTAASNAHSASLSLCTDYLFQNCHFGVIAYARSTGRSIALSQCINTIFEDTYQYNAYAQVTTSFGTKFIGIDHCDRLVGATNSTTGMNVISILTSADDVLVDGITFGLKGTIVDYCNPYSAPIYFINSSNLIFRNAGTKQNPLVCNPAAAPQYVIQDGGANTNIKCQRLYLSHSRTAILTTINTTKNLIVEHVYGTTGAVQLASLNTLAKGIKNASASTTGAASVYGTHCFDMFLSDTTGLVQFCMNEPTLFNNKNVKLTLTTSVGGFTSAGDVAMPAVGDELIMDFPYYIIGHTGFDNIAPTITGTNTGNFLIEYDLDTGGGFTNSYKVLNAANLFAETVSPSTGFNIRLRITTAIANTTNALRYISARTVSTALAQQDNLYPLNVSKITLTDFALGTRIQIYNMTDNVEVYNGVPTSTTFVYETPYITDKTYRVRAMYQNGVTAMQFIEFEESFTASGFTRKLVQEVDPIYVTNNIDGSTVSGITIDDGDFLVSVDTGYLTWQEFYAYETYWLKTVEGIRDEQRFITPIDQANYVFEGFKIKNITNPSVPLIITGGHAKDSVTGDTLGLLDTTGGTIFTAPDRVIPFATSGGSGSGLTTIEHNVLMALPDQLQVINAGVKKASILIPHTQNIT